MIDSLRIPYLGTYKNSGERTKRYPLQIIKNGFNIVFLNYTYGTNGIDPVSPNIVNFIDKDIINEDIKTARRMKPDAIIACIHWGWEYKSLPNREQKELAQWLFSKGVTHIIGAHPHVLQPMEIVKNPNSLEQNVLVYSLGNFISNMSAPNTDGGAMVKLELKKINNITRTSNCNYALTWTSRPAVSHKKNYIIYPVSSVKDSLNTEEKRLMNNFTKSARQLLEKHNVGIKEYTLE